MSKEEPVDRASQWSVNGISILNGMFGDYLQQQNNGLAIDMALMLHDKPLLLDKASLRQAYPDSGGRLCLFVHGLCCNERSWEFAGDGGQPDGASFGSLLQAEFGLTPLFLRYNTGLPLARNGGHFSALLDELISAFPVPVTELILVGHSMGGLIMRSAFEHAATEPASAWPALVSKAFYLGTPHEGADLAKFAHATASVLEAVPNSITRLIGDVLNLRSEGIKNLRDGKPLGAAQASQGTAAPIWHAGLQHYLIAGTLHEDPQHIVNQVFGDGLVRVPGQAAAGGADMPAIADEHIKVFPGVHHMALLTDRAVYEQIRTWIQ